MPACDISASIAMRAPVMGLPVASDNLRATVAGPTRAGSGEISCSIATTGDGSTCREQPAPSNIAAHANATSHLRGSYFRKLFDTPRSGSFCRIVAAPFARACRVSPLARRREYVVVHRDDHRDEHDRVIEKMEL